MKLAAAAAAAALLIADLAAATAPTAPAGARVVHMRADGSDRHSGQSNAVAVRTLGRVH
eukprot:SAG22_NODE_21273_length_258_cov_0.974843_1_plen_58_part_10